MTAVRRFLARLEKQTAVRALIFAGLLALIAAAECGAAKRVKESQK